MGSSESQGKLWGAAAEDWASLFEPLSKPIWVAMLDATAVGRGTRFLDLGCGGGGATILAFERGAHVSGLDAAANLIAIAQKRMPSGDFRVGDLEALPYEDGCFDVTFASMSIMFATNPSAALREMKRVTTMGGHVAIGIWGQPADCEYRHILKAVADTLPTPPRGPGPFALSKRGIMEELMQAVGLKVLVDDEVDAPFQFSDFEQMWRIVSSAGPVQSAIQLSSAQKVRDAIIEAARPFQTDNGDILLHNRFRYIAAAIEKELS